MAKKIAIIDYTAKFMTDLEHHWIACGHEIKKDRYMDPKKINWADTVFFDFCDMSAQRSSHEEDPLWHLPENEEKFQQPLDKNIIIRIHDLDAWVGQHNGVNWKWVNHVVFIASHIKEKVERELGERLNGVQSHLIKHGLNIDRFTFRERAKGNKIAWVGNICHHKNLELALQVLAENPDYELHVCGRPLCNWQKAYTEHFVKKNNLKFFQQDWVEDINTFLEDKNYLLLTSCKEAFSFAVAEAMTKGIKPLIHRFYKAEEIWDEKYIWDKVSQVKPMLEGEYNSKEYRDYIETNYPLNKMLEEYNKII